MTTMGFSPSFLINVVHWGADHASDGGNWAENEVSLVELDR